MSRIFLSCRTAAVVSVSFLMIACSPAALASVIYSNSFENADGYPLAPASLASTTGPGLSGNVVVYNNNNYLGPTTDGTQYAVFNPADGVSGGSFTSSSINTVNGATYTLSFEYGFFGVNPPQTLLVTAQDSVTTVDLLSTTVSTAAHSGGLNPYSLSFVGTGNPVQLEFLDTTTGGAPNSNSAIGNASDGLFDHVVVSGLAVPEPGSLLLWSVAAGLFCMRRLRAITFARHST